MQEDWVDRYEHRVEDYRLPAGKQAREDYAVVRGKDGANLLSALYAAEAPAWLAEIPAVETLRRVWVQHFYWEQGELCWRDASNVPQPGIALIRRLIQKRTTRQSAPRVGWATKCISPKRVMTTVRTCLPMSKLRPRLWQMMRRFRSCTKHWRHTICCQAFTWWIQAMEMPRSWSAVSSSMASISSGQPVRRGLANQDAICPAGQKSHSWTPAQDRRGNPVIKIKFAMQDCRPCPSREQCTHSQSASPRRVLTVRPQEQYQALQTARQRQATETFKTAYAARAGIEGMLSQGIRAFGLRQARYRGQAKVHLQHVLTATALNLCRRHAWLTEQPRAHTRQAAFVRLVKKRA